MQFQDVFPFYIAYPYWMPTLQEREQEKDLRTMQSFYSQTAMRIQEKVERECDRMEYDGSLMFDEYPDKFMMEHLCRKIEKQLKQEEQEWKMQEQMQVQEMDDMGKNCLRDLVGVLLFNEMYRRRCRRRKSRGLF